MKGAVTWGQAQEHLTRPENMNQRHLRKSVKLISRQDRAGVLDHTHKAQGCQSMMYTTRGTKRASAHSQSQLQYI
jgi:hypothetical protein